MTLEQYQELTGITVPDSQQGIVEAQIARTQAILETLLGYTLDPEKVLENLYNEEGKTTRECACPNVDTQNLQPADPVEYAYRLYTYNDKDKYFYVDPFTSLNKVKLVWNNITIKTFSENEIRVHYGRDGWSKYIEHCIDCLCVCGCTDCVQLAVDADWLWQCEEGETSCLPADLLYVWADMITYYTDCKKDVKQESIGAHSYTKFDKNTPEMETGNRAVIKRYAGPYGAVNKVITV